MAPHLAEDLWATYGDGKSGTLFHVSWPESDPKALQVDTETLVIQVNGKVRAQIEVAVSISAEEAKKLARENPKVLQFTDGKSIRREIHVPHRLVNLVVG